MADAVPKYSVVREGRGQWAVVDWSLGGQTAAINTVKLFSTEAAARSFVKECVEPAPPNDYIAPILKRLTLNGARNLKGTLEHASADYPDAINGNRRIDTGSGKWTHIASLGVEANLRSLGLVEDRRVNLTNDNHWMMLAITPLGREVAAYIIAHWDELYANLRDLSGRGR